MSASSAGAGGAASARGLLPADAERATLVGRVWDPETRGPRPVVVRGDEVVDLFDVAPTVAGLLELDDVVERVRAAPPGRRWRIDELRDAPEGSDPAVARLLAPVDLQVIKACGVTFVDSMLERVIEERCAGDPERAAEVRAAVGSAIGEVVGSVVPGSAEAARVKEVLMSRELWSPYLEVGLGPDPEVFTKGPVLSAVGPGAAVGVPRFSRWNNPEPELVLVVDSHGRPRGATLGNDVNLRDVEGRSALLLGMAKDNTASTALGPFVRLFDEHLTIGALRSERIALRVDGAGDGFVLADENDVGRLSRTFEELVGAAWGEHHQYPDGFVLFTGTLFAPTRDREVPGGGFTHRAGDTVAISSPHLGTLANVVRPTEEVPRWELGLRSLVEYLCAQAGGDTRSIVTHP
ncbi:fumarylacetoacetate hydrolase family protein [Isoptericola sp. QY 916]|uniref:fumarylacetoacetate hydrolase family protein n=1 Tax=Isoptericola sp. QY 916 TaxID=2782570 RepID=UPI003D300BD3|nr:fumarylacetoacetate hydrolase family protein [Isoptericola sp. QY 916]